MKKLIVLVPVFLFVFGFTAGMVFTTSDQVQAIDMCNPDCLFESYCSNITGPNCMSNPHMPYYKYWKPTCVAGPYNCSSDWIFYGCCAHLLEIPRGL